MPASAVSKVLCCRPAGRMPRSHGRRRLRSDARGNAPCRITRRHPVDLSTPCTTTITRHRRRHHVAQQSTARVATGAASSGHHRRSRRSFGGDGPARALDTLGTPPSDMPASRSRPSAFSTRPARNSAARWPTRCIHGVTTSCAGTLPESRIRVRARLHRGGRDRSSGVAADRQERIAPGTRGFADNDPQSRPNDSPDRMIAKPESSGPFNPSAQHANDAHELSCDGKLHYDGKMLLKSHATTCVDNLGMTN